MSRHPIALTFDDGPSDWTGEILEILAANHATATFFVIGSLAASRVELVGQIVAGGHELGNHTWSHPAMARDCSDEVVVDELAKTNVLLAELFGSAPTLYRAPHYDRDARVDQLASTLGLAHARGDIAPPDWHERWTAPLTATFVLKHARPGAVIGLHDGIPPRDGAGASRAETVAAVALIVPRLHAAGFRCVTASRLFTESTSAGAR